MSAVIAGYIKQGECKPEVALKCSYDELFESKGARVGDKVMVELTYVSKDKKPTFLETY